MLPVQRLCSLTWFTAPVALAGSVYGFPYNLESWPHRDRQAKNNSSTTALLSACAAQGLCLGEKNICNDL